MQRKSMPRSCYTILQYLETMPGQQTHKDLVSGTGLAPRTIRNSVRRLKEEGFIVEKFNFRDARQTLYSVNTAMPHPITSATV